MIGYTNNWPVDPGYTAETAETAPSRRDLIDLVDAITLPFVDAEADLTDELNDALDAVEARKTLTPEQRKQLLDAATTIDMPAALRDWLGS